MASVTGVTAARADEIADQLIIGATRSGTTLVFTKADGTTIQVQNAFAKIIDSYPVNSIYMSTSSSNPSTYMGGGTWVRWGKGRVPVSVDEADSDFNTVEKTGGVDAVTLTAAQTGIPIANMVQKYPGGNQYFNVSSDTDPNNRAILVGPAPASQAHTNLQPYITCYIWKRTA